MRFIKQTIYALKRQYGLASTYVGVTQGDPDITTGIKISIERRIPINKTIFLPNELYRVFLKEGADYNINNRVVLIDGKDIDIIPTINDYIIKDSNKYIVTEVTKFDAYAAYILIVKESLGSTVNEDFIIEDTLTIVDENARS